MRYALRFALLLLLGVGQMSHACDTYIDGDLDRLARHYAEAFGLDGDLVVALVWQESRFCPDALGTSGEVGLGQLMPQTAEDIGVDPVDPAQNLWGTCYYLREQYLRFGDWELALAAYNAGPGRVAKGVIPESTRVYVDMVFGFYDALQRAP